MNPTRADPGSPPVVVAGAYLTGVVLMRQLVRRGVSCCAVDCIPDQPGFKTVYGKAHHCPDPDRNPEGWVSFMIDLARKIGQRPVLIPSADQFVTAISQHADALAPHFTFCHGGAVVQDLLATKRRQYDIAGGHGLPVPLTQLVHSLDDVHSFIGNARFPCILKPIHFRNWERVPANHPVYAKKLLIANSPEDLIEKYRLAAEADPEAVLQDIIVGPDTAKLVYLSVYSTRGERIASCLLRQVRTAPIYFGSASVVEPISDAETDALCDRFLRNISYAGLCELELKRDSIDGQVKLIEANPRYSLTADAGRCAGVDLGWLHYLDLIGRRVTPVVANNRDFRHITLFRDFSTIASYRREGLLSWRALFRSYRPPVAFFDIDFRDWRLTAANIWSLFKILLFPYVGRFLPKHRSSASRRL